MSAGNSTSSPVPRKEKPGRPAVERLPHGSAFEVSYDARAMKWTGTLTVTTPEGGPVFEGEAGGVFRLLSTLDAQYRRWAAGQAAPAAERGP
jgi:hypothetical protein